MRDAAIRLDDIDEEEVDVIAFPFGAWVGTGQSITTAVVTASLMSGVDGTPDAMRSGAPQVQGASVLQPVVGRVVGADYKLRCKATRSDGQVRVIAYLLKVVRL